MDDLNLPSAQLEVAKRTAETVQNVSKSDLISRKAVIEVLDRTQWLIPDAKNALKDHVRMLPSAQPRTKCIAEIKISKEDLDKLVAEKVEEIKAAQPEQRWIPCSEPPEDDKNVFIAHGKKNFMSCCIGHYDHESGLWYEDRNWFARPIYDGVYWCEMPILPETEE